MKFHLEKVILVSIISVIAINLMAQTTTYDVRLNQVGFLPNSIKWAAVVNSKSDSFRILTSDLKDTVFKGQFLVSSH